jgi:hypothetical protein
LRYSAVTWRVLSQHFVTSSGTVTSGADAFLRLPEGAALEAAGVEGADPSVDAVTVWTRESAPPPGGALVELLLVLAAYLGGRGHRRPLELSEVFWCVQVEGLAVDPEDLFRDGRVFALGLAEIEDGVDASGDERAVCALELLDGVSAVPDQGLDALPGVGQQRHDGAGDEARDRNTLVDARDVAAPTTSLAPVMIGVDGRVTVVLGLRVGPQTAGGFPVGPSTARVELRGRSCGMARRGTVAVH